MSTEDTDDEKETPKKKKDKDEYRRPKSASVTPEDPDFVQWLHDLTAHGETVQRIECWQVFDKGRVLGTNVHTETFKTARAITGVDATELAHAFLLHAQRNCTRVCRRRQSYSVRAYDGGRASDTFREYPLDLKPRIEGLATMGQVSLFDGIDEDELATDGKKLQFLQLKDARESSHALMRFAGGMAGETFLILRDQVQSQADYILQLQGQIAERDQTISRLHQEMNSLRDNDLDRELAREDKRLWIDIKKDGWKHGRNMLTSIFGGSGGGSNGANGTAANGQQLYPNSKERDLVDSFLEDCTKEKIDGILFGDWDVDEKTDELICKKEGIFTPAQFKILYGVQNRLLPPDALDALLMDSGKPEAVTEEQTKKGRKYITDGIGSSLFMAMQRRMEARAKNTDDKKDK